APASLLFPQWQSSNELLGPFFAGFRETIGEVSENVDGGELYGLRSTSEFLNSYNWRKYTIASTGTNCAFIPGSNPDDRTTWSSHTSIGFGVYDSNDPTTGRTMDSTIVTPTLQNALAQTDHYVWFYTEAGSFLLPPGTTGAASQTWVDAVRAALTPQPTSPSSVVYGGWFDVGANALPTPTFLGNNATWIDANLPFDGFVVHLSSGTTNYTSTVLGSSSISTASMDTLLAPLMNGVNSKFTRLKDNFVLVQTLNAPDWFAAQSVWDTVNANFGNLAQACVDRKLKGIFFDNENYGNNWGKASPGHTAADTQVKARERGKAVMQAMVAKFPGIAVISAHGPYLSEPGSQGAFTGSPWLASLYPVTGAFFVGFREGLGGSTVNVDGGELYTLKSAADFQSAYTWRKTTFATNTYNSGAGCAFLPASNPDDRTNWSTATSIGFGIYDGKFNASGVSLADGTTTAQTVLSNALHQADRYTWFYAEGRTFFLAPGSDPKAASQTWVDMMNAGRVH
ncbi:MAG: hypothetical protein JO332_01650, partial [Planctomycetaceae bacterium]|nr:hypothetical protein [Planctomycetaceae bacterium]